jgi:HEAT repeat protein
VAPERSFPAATARRRRAARAGHAGDAATAIELLADPDPLVRATALRAVERAGALTDDMVRTCGRDASAVVRVAALEVAARRDAPDLDAVVIALLDDDDPTVVDAAAWCAGERERANDTVLERLIAITTGNADALVRETSVAALGAIGDERGLPAILAATRDRATVRRRAVLALAPFDGDEVREALERATTDRDWQVRQAAEDLLS